MTLSRSFCVKEQKVKVAVIVFDHLNGLGKATGLACACLCVRAIMFDLNDL